MVKTHLHRHKTLIDERFLRSRCLDTSQAIKELMTNLPHKKLKVNFLPLLFNMSFLFFKERSYLKLFLQKDAIFLSSITRVFW